MSNTLSNVERGFRYFFGGVAIAPVVLGAVTQPSQMFALVVVNIYFVMTAIIGYDPLYALQGIAANSIRSSFRQENEQSEEVLVV